MRAIVSVLLLWGLMCHSVRAQETDVGSVETSSQAAVSQEEQVKLGALLPDPAATGAQAGAAPAFFGENLWEYIDGAAEAFHQYGFVALIHQEYKAQDADVTLDVYDMGDPRNAFGMYVSERSLEARPVEVGVEGHGDEFSLCFFQGPYYAKLSGFRQNGVAAPILAKLAKAVSERIGGESALPAGVAVLPEENRQPRSLTFVLTAPLGHAFLAPAFMARYFIAGKETKLVLSEAASESDALARQRSLQAHFEKAGEVTPSTVVPGALVGATSFEGRMLFLVIGSRLVVLAPPPDDPKPLIEAIRARFVAAN